MAALSDTKHSLIDPNMSAPSHIPMSNTHQIVELSPISVGAGVAVMDEQMHKSPSPSAYAMPPQQSDLSPHNGHHSNPEDDEENDEFYPSRRNHSYKRAEEPPRNSQNKMICKFDHKDCRGLTFERKCEWSKHMDKHDRPYKCHARGCEKLRGFTYSGGLLRHEREVHKMHGGTKKSLYCPHADCKRSSGAGFTRKENLAEHVRRVHRASTGGADLNGLTDANGLSDSLVRSPDADNQWLADQKDNGLSMPDLDPALAQLETEAARKRKRDMNDSDIAPAANMSDHSDLREEIKRLKQDNDEKDARLRHLEQVIQQMQAKGTM